MSRYTGSFRATSAVEGEEAIDIYVGVIAADGHARWTASYADCVGFNAAERLVVGQAYTPERIERGE